MSLHCPKCLWRLFISFHIKFWLFFQFSTFRMTSIALFSLSTHQLTYHTYTTFMLIRQDALLFQKQQSRLLHSLHILFSGMSSPPLSWFHPSFQAWFTSFLLQDAFIDNFRPCWSLQVENPNRTYQLCSPIKFRWLPYVSHYTVTIQSLYT